MSLGASGWSDIVVDLCLTAHVREVTHARGHVALHELVERHARAGMSRLARIRSPLYARVERGVALRLQAGVVVAVCVGAALSECDGLRLRVRRSALDARVGARLIRVAPRDAV